MQISQRLVQRFLIILALNQVEELFKTSIHILGINLCRVILRDMNFYIVRNIPAVTASTTSCHLLISCYQDQIRHFIE